MDQDRDNPSSSNVIPLFSKDEMNLVEFPLGPLTTLSSKTLEIDHPVYDRQLKRVVNRRLIITGADAFGLPRPIDEQVLIGLKALTYEAGFTSRKVEFSQYQLCRTLGWKPDGRAYQRLEASLDRLAGTTLKFKDSWWDQGEQEWKTHTFHLIENVELCSRNRLQKQRALTKRQSLALNRFTWNEVVFKSFQDGFIKSIDMAMYRKISAGRRREVPLRLYRILDKRFHKTTQVTVELRKLCVGKLGMSPGYSPSQMVRVLKRACDWLIECRYLRDVTWKEAEGSVVSVTFRKETGRKPASSTNAASAKSAPVPTTSEKTVRTAWLSRFTEAELQAAEEEALKAEFGTQLQRNMVQNNRAEGKAILESGAIRQGFVKDYLLSCKQSEEKAKRASAA